MEKLKTVVTAFIDKKNLNILKEYCDITLTGWAKTGIMLNEEEMVEALKDADILLVGYEKVSEYVIKNSPKLKLIGCTRGNPINVDSKFAKSCKIPVIYTPARNANSAAEYTMGMILSEVRNIARAFYSLKIGLYVGPAVQNVYDLPEKDDVVWNLDQDSPYKKFRGYELNGRTLGLVGFGNIATRISKMAKAFEMNVLAFDPYCSENTAKENGVKLVSLDTLLKKSDFISLHCKVTDETKGLIGEKELGMMKPTAYLVNTARAAIINQRALVKALTEHKIAGAALDVYWYEPIPANHPLLSLDNVTLTPHLAGASYDVPARHSEMIVEDTIQWIKGEKPERVFEV